MFLLFACVQDCFLGGGAWVRGYIWKHPLEKVEQLVKNNHKGNEKKPL